MYKLDYGKHELVSMRKVQPLADMFRKLPFQAVTARLAGKCWGVWTSLFSRVLLNIWVVYAFIAVLRKNPQLHILAKVNKWKQRYNQQENIAWIIFHNLLHKLWCIYKMDFHNYETFLACRIWPFSWPTFALQLTAQKCVISAHSHQPIDCHKIWGAKLISIEWYFFMIVSDEMRFYLLWKQCSISGPSLCPRPLVNVGA